MPRASPTITIKQGAKSIVLERKGEEWSLKNSGGYPVPADRVRALLVKLASAELVDRKTRNPERHALLELEDPAGKDAKSRQVIDRRRAGQAARRDHRRQAQRRAARHRQGRHLRASPGEKDTWLVSGELDPNPAVNQWVDTTIFEAEIAKVARVRIDAPGAPQLGVDREAGKPANKDGYKLVGMPEGKKLKYEYALEDIVNAFARVELEDVRKPVAPAAGAAAPATAVFEAETGSEDHHDRARHRRRPLDDGRGDRRRRGEGRCRRRSTRARPAGSSSCRRGRPTSCSRSRATSTTRGE